MRNVQKVLTGIFLSGILIGGVGTGIAMVEYSSLVYGGEKLIGEESLVTRNLDYQFEPDGGTLELAGFRYWNRDEIQEIEIDSGVPVGTVRYEVTYNEKSVSPSLVFEPYEEEEEEITEGDSDIVDENSERLTFRKRVGNKGRRDKKNLGICILQYLTMMMTLRCLWRIRIVY